MDTNTVVDFGIRLKQALKTRNMNQTKLSELSGINNSTISEYISGKYEPNRTRIAEFSKILNVDEVWLMGYDVPMIKESVPLTLYEKKQLLENIEKEYRNQNKNIATLCSEYNIETFDEYINDRVLMQIVQDLKIPFNNGKYLNKTFNSEIRNWFLSTINSLSDEDLKKLKPTVKATIEIINNKTGGI